jgi:hypothetical protein
MRVPAEQLLQLVQEFWLLLVVYSPEPQEEQVRFAVVEPPKLIRVPAEQVAQLLQLP